jgi:hypothetical protein
MNQSVIVFADAAARGTAIPSPVEGMLTYLQDTNAYESWNGSAFVNINDNTDAIPKSTVTTSQDLIVADGASSVTRLGVGADDQILSVVAGEVSWADPVSSVITTEGDLIVGNALGEESRIGIGLTGKLLSSDGTTAVWTDPPAAPSLTLLGTLNMTGVSTATVSSISQDYKYLRIEGTGFTNTSSSVKQINIRFNSDTGTNYFTSNSASYQSFSYNGSAINATFQISDTTTSAAIVAEIPHYNKTNVKKFIEGTHQSNAGGGPVNYMVYFRGAWNNTAAITSITFYTSFTAFTAGEFKIYGVN